MYFRIRHDKSVETIGEELNQIHGFNPELPYEYWKDKGPDQLKDRRFSDLYLDGYYLNDKAKLTDYITGFRGGSYEVFILSKNFAKILKDFKIPKYELLDFGFYQNQSSIYRFQIFRALWGNFDLDQKVDFQKSKYARYDVANNFLNEVEISSHSDLIQECSVFKGPFPFKGRKIVLKPEFDFDLFTMRSITGLLCSDNFKRRIEYEVLSGMIFEPMEDLIQFVE